MESNPLSELELDTRDAQAEANRLASNHVAEIGAALVGRGHTADAVFAMVDSGAEPDEIMAGLAKRVTRIRDKIPGIRRGSTDVYKLFDRSQLTDYPD